MLNIGIRGVTLLWFENYLTGRLQQVQCNGELSSFKLSTRDVNKDLTPKDQDKDKDLEYVLKDKDEDKDHS